jgi:hypothetical protein
MWLCVVFLVLICLAAAILSDSHGNVIATVSKTYSLVDVDVGFVGEAHAASSSFDALFWPSIVLSLCIEGWGGHESWWGGRMVVGIGHFDIQTRTL